MDEEHHGRGAFCNCGRMERLWGTLQSSLPPLLRRAGVLRHRGGQPLAQGRLHGDHNCRFAVAPAEEGSAVVHFVGDFDDILCIEEERVVGNDSTVRYEGHVLQIS